MSSAECKHKLTCNYLNQPLRNTVLGTVQSLKLASGGVHSSHAKVD